jgi:putative nucleotidyltransferase with HDIG domain
LHSQRVRDYALLLADRLWVADPARRESLAMGALLHDIGKIGIPDRILLKAGGLDEEERGTMRRHPELGARLLEKIGFLGQAREIVLAHHERFDGSGYPSGLAGRAIPAGARVFAVVDAFDAMTTDRPYSVARSYVEASSRIIEASGSQFDPAVVQAFSAVPYEAWSEVAARYGIVLRRA